MVVASDTVILVHLIHAIDRLSLDNIPHRVQMKFDDDKFVDVNYVCSNLPEKVRKLLPAYHSTTEYPFLYPFGVGKVKPFKKALKKDRIGLLQCFQNEENKEMKPAENIYIYIYIYILCKIYIYIYIYIM